MHSVLHRVRTLRYAFPELCAAPCHRIVCHICYIGKRVDVSVGPFLSRDGSETCQSRGSAVRWNFGAGRFARKTLPQNRPIPPHKRKHNLPSSRATDLWPLIQHTMEMARLKTDAAVSFFFTLFSQPVLSFRWNETLISNEIPMSR